MSCFCRPFARRFLDPSSAVVPRSAPHPEAGYIGTDRDPGIGSGPLVAASRSGVAGRVGARLSAPAARPERLRELGAEACPCGVAAWMPRCCFTGGTRANWSQTAWRSATCKTVSIFMMRHETFYLPARAILATPAEPGDTRGVAGRVLSPKLPTLNFA